jgi:hypothetical protein
MERIAIGYLRMTSEDLEIYSPRELQWRYEAELLREDREFERLAQVACWVINPWLGKNANPIKVKDLLRRGGGKVKSEPWWEDEA